MVTYFDELEMVLTYFDKFKSEISILSENKTSSIDSSSLLTIFTNFCNFSGSYFSLILLLEILSQKVTIWI